jgi:hypothetical protein
LTINIIKKWIVVSFAFYENVVDIWTSVMDFYL